MEKTRRHSVAFCPSTRFCDVLAFKCKSIQKNFNVSCSTPSNPNIHIFTWVFLCTLKLFADHFKRKPKTLTKLKQSSIMIITQ